MQCMDLIRVQWWENNMQRYTVVQKSDFMKPVYFSLVIAPCKLEHLLVAYEFLIHIVGIQLNIISENDPFLIFLVVARSFCKKHRPVQTCSTRPTLPLCCSICLEPIDAVLSYSVLKCPACHGSWFHRSCVQVVYNTHTYIYRSFSGMLLRTLNNRNNSPFLLLSFRHTMLQCFSSNVLYATTKTSFSKKCSEWEYTFQKGIVLWFINCSGLFTSNSLFTDFHLYLLETHHGNWRKMHMGSYYKCTSTVMLWNVVAIKDAVTVHSQGKQKETFSICEPNVNVYHISTVLLV